MMLDLIAWAPEAQLLLSLLLILCYGTGPAVNPVIEHVWIPKTETVNYSGILFKNSTTTNSKSNDFRFIVENTLQNVGPNHTATYLAAWTLTWCLLGACMIWFCPLTSFQAGGVFMRDSFTSNLGATLWLTAAICMALSLPWQKIAGIIHGEYFVLVTLALFGMHLLIMTTDLMALYVCLELQSFSLVVLCSLNYASAHSIEAGIKFFLLSAFSSCLMLLGIGCIYWDTGLTNCTHLQELLAATLGEPSLGFWIGLWLVGLSLLWKLAAAPLHFWAADVYMGSWSSVTLMISTLPKIAVLGFWVHTWHPLWTSAFGSSAAIFSGLSLIVGAIAPLGQAHMKRLLAFSSIGHIGLLLIPLASNQGGMTAMWVHLALYIITSIAVWGLLMWPFGRANHPVSGPQYIWDLAGLHESNSMIALAWVPIVLSLAGLPPAAGFLGKLGLLWWGLDAQLYGLVTLALLATLLGSVYYLRILKVSYVDSPSRWSSYGPCHPLTGYIVAICTLVLLVGLWHGTPLILASHLLMLSSKISLITIAKY